MDKVTQLGGGIAGIPRQGTWLGQGTFHSSQEQGSRHSLLPALQGWSCSALWRQTDWRSNSSSASSSYVTRDPKQLAGSFVQLVSSLQLRILTPFHDVVPSLSNSRAACIKSPVRVRTRQPVHCSERWIGEGSTKLWFNQLLSSKGAKALLAPILGAVIKSLKWCVLKLSVNGQAFASSRYWR